MELNSSVNTFLQGMNLDSDISLLKENQYTYAENIRLLANEDSTTGVLQNRDCLKKFKTFLREEEKILGTTVTRLFKETISQECIIIITEYIGLNNIYIIYNNDYSNYEKFLLNANIGWRNKLNIVPNYESDTVSKLYVSDGKSSIKVINLNNTYDSSVTSDDLEIAPKGVLFAPSLDKIIKGSLSVGAVQYAYQLFVKHGAESQISPVSQLIPIPKKHSTTNSIETSGGDNGELSDIGCQISFEFEKNQFNYVRVYRIKYEKNNSIPYVYIIAEFPIDSNKITYLDKNDSFISLITVDEFNQLSLAEFLPNILEKHENRLFAAGILEKTWSVNYDARAYRCDNAGFIDLNSNSTATITGRLNPDGTIDGNPVPDKHDCINPSNESLFDDDSFKYVYGYRNGKFVYGGCGPNVSYEFCFVKVNLDDSVPVVSGNVSYPSSNLDLCSKELRTTHISVYDYENNEILQKPINNTSGIILNYSDSWFTANFLGYQRDEIYRFGIVFYNKKNQKSNVCWIGDIRMPGHQMAKDTTDKLLPFHFNEPLDSDDLSIEQKCNMTGYSMGIVFHVNNIPEDAVRWEIVRCPRTEIDRTIVTQGVLSSIVKYTHWGSTGSTDIFGESDVRPMALLNLSKNYRTCSGSSTYLHAVINDLFEFVTPDACVSKLSILDNIKNSDLCQLNWYSTLFSGSKWGMRQPTFNSQHTNPSIDRTNANWGRYYNSSSYYLDFYNASSGSYGQSGNALLLKYYAQKNKEESYSKSYTIDNAILTTILPYQYTNDDAKQYAQPIADKNYINTTVGNTNYLSSHGRSVILLMGQDYIDSNPLHTTSTTTVNFFTTMNATRVCNIKQRNDIYGGYSYENRTNSTYIPCVNHKIDNDSNSVCVFGGDTYLGVFDYTHTTMRQTSNDPESNDQYTFYINCYIPLESSINFNMFSSDNYSKTVGSGSYGQVAQNLIQYEPIVTSNYTQTKPLYEYNSAYSVDATAQLFVPELLYTDENPIFETRITCSELKTNNEIIDSWTKFKFANYIDVDNRYGPVTNLKSFNGKLFFWQDSAVGVASVNERSLIQDNNIAQLTLGTGGILVRYDYHTTLNGSSIANDRSICNSISTLYWYDTDKHEICAINNTVIELSKVKGVKSWCNKLLGRSETLGWYDWKYNEVLFLNKSEDAKRSIVFNELLNTFTGFYTYPASHVALMVDKLITLDDMGNIYTHDSDVNYEPFESKITYVINKGYPETKVFDNVWFDAELSTDETLKSIVFKTKTLETNPITFEGVENREDTYRFPIPRDKNGVARMRGKYLICDYTFDCTNDGDFKIPYIKTTFRISRV